MRRYWIEKNQIQNENVHFEGEIFHHIFGVCRQEVGHHFEVITFESIAYLVEVTQVNKKNATARIIEHRIIEPLKKPHLHLALAISRYHVMDSTIERAVELGVAHFHPFVSDYSFIRKIKELPAGKFERWDKIIKSATQQSGRGDLMKIHDVQTFDDLIHQINPKENPWCLWAYEGESSLNINQKISLLKDRLVHFPEQKMEDLWIIIGSEGGFSTQEVEKMVQLGLDPVTIGQQILRVETACLALIAVLKYEFGLMQ